MEKLCISEAQIVENRRMARDARICPHRPTFGSQLADSPGASQGADGKGQSGLSRSFRRFNYYYY